jgi:hypothetical protein
MHGNCSVADQFCVSAANFEYCEQVRTKCYSCGLPVCKSCSLIITYHKKRCRLCHTCVEQYTGNDTLIWAHLHELAT